MVLRYKDISLELNWNFPWYVALKVLESAMKVLGGRKGMIILNSNELYELQ